MERKLGIEAGCLKGVAEIDALEKIKAAGFEAFFSGGCDVAYICALKEKAEQVGLYYDFVHAPFGGINNLWRSGLDHVAIFDKIIGSIDGAAAAGVKTVVCHVSSGWWPPHLNDIGFDRFDRLVAHAVRKGVHIAFENIRKPGNLAAIMERYERIPNVGFCFDCGHEHCYTETIPYLDLYGKRTICTHIHDNYGRDKEDIWKDADYHLLPFEGTYDYKAMMDRLNKYEYDGCLCLEVGNGKHPEMTEEEFLSTCYGLIKKISEL